MGLFDAYDVDAADIPETQLGIPEGTHEGVISAAEIRTDVYKQGTNDRFLCIDVTVPGYNFPSTLSLMLPVGSRKTWATDGVFEANYNNPNITYTEEQVMTRRLQRIRDTFEALGVPGEAQNDLEPADLINLEVVGTWKANKKGYVNLIKIVVKKNDEQVVEASEPAGLASLGW